MLLLVKNRIYQLFTLFLLLVSGPALGGGGDWKMGPFGPYWDDNSWPEFTPMYWMEEFMNRLDDDDDEIQSWMLRNQFPGQYPGTGLQGVYPQDAWQPDGWTGSRAQSTDRTAGPRRDRAPGGNTYIIGDNHPSQSVPENEQGSLPYLTPEEFARMPVELQREYKRAFDREYQIVSKPQSTSAPRSARRAEQPPLSAQQSRRRPLLNLTPQEYARMPVELQREYKRAFDEEYYGASRPAKTPARRPLPDLTPQEYARMPADMQREYRRAFDREYGASPASRSRLPMLTPEEYASMPVDLQRQYKREFDRQYAEYLARKHENDRRSGPAPDRQYRTGGNP